MSNKMTEKENGRKRIRGGENQTKRSTTQLAVQRKSGEEVS